MQKKPIILLPKHPIVIFLNIVSLIIMIGNMVYLFMMWSDLHSPIPIHFSGNGIPDRWGQKGMLWIIPSITVILWVGMTILEKFPHTYNYVNLTERNVENQYQNARIMLNVLKTELTMFFAYISWESIQWGNGNQVSLGNWGILIFLVFIFGTMLFFIIRSLKLK